MTSAIVAAIRSGSTTVGMVLSTLRPFQQWGNISENQIRNLIKVILGLPKETQIDEKKTHAALKGNKHYDFAVSAELEIGGN